MTVPFSRRDLHQRSATRDETVARTASLECELDAVLAEPSASRNSAPSSTQPTDAERLEELRDRFRLEIVPLVNAVAERCREREIGVRLDASDFLAGRRGVNLEIDFEGHVLALAGTMTRDGLAFMETRRHPNAAGTVGGGPTLRFRELHGQAMCEFVYDRALSLVREAKRQRA